MNQSFRKKMLPVIAQILTLAMLLAACGVPDSGETTRISQEHTLTGVASSAQEEGNIPSQPSEGWTENIPPNPGASGGEDAQNPPADGHTNGGWIDENEED